jgi:hypothetical protein
MPEADLQPLKSREEWPRALINRLRTFKTGVLNLSYARLRTDAN